MTLHLIKLSGLAILQDVKAEGLKVAQIIMDHDTSGGNISVVQMW